MRPPVIVGATVLLALAGCRSGASAVRTNAVTDSAVRTETIAVERTRVVTVGTLAADSVALLVTADSIVTPSGAMLHRPRLRLRAASPRAMRTDTVQTAAVGRETADVVAKSASRTVTAIPESRISLVMTLLIVLLGIVAARRFETP